MRGMKIFFAVCMAILCATQVFASVDMFYGFRCYNATNGLQLCVRINRWFYQTLLLVRPTKVTSIVLGTESCCIITGGLYEYWYYVPLATYDPINRVNVDRYETNEIIATVQEGTFPVGTRN